MFLHITVLQLLQHCWTPLRPLINTRDTRPTWCSLTYAWPHFTDDTKAPMFGKRSVTHQTVTKPFSSLMSPKHEFPHWALVAFLSPLPLSVLPGLNGLCGWSINSVIQRVDSCSRVNVCSQACRRDGPRPTALCLLWSLIRLEVNGGPCAEVAGAWMEPPLTWPSHRGRTGSDHCDTC